MKYSEGLVLIVVGARLPVLKGESSSIRGAAGLVFMNSRSSSACVEGRARQ